MLQARITNQGNVFSFFKWQQFSRLESGYPFASVPVRCTKTTLFKTCLLRRAETVSGTTARLSDLSMPSQLCVSPLKGQVRSSPGPSVRPSSAADSIGEKRQICTACVLVRTQRWVVKRRRSYAFSHRGSHFRLRGGWEREKDLT